MAHECTWESFIDTVAEFLGMEAVNFNEKTNIYNDLELDSLGLFSLGMTLLKEYSITVPLTALSSITTIGQMYAALVDYSPSCSVNSTALRQGNMPPTSSNSP